MLLGGLRLASLRFHQMTHPHQQYRESTLSHIMQEYRFVVCGAISILPDMPA